MKLLAHFPSGPSTERTPIMSAFIAGLDSTTFPVASVMLETFHDTAKGAAPLNSSDAPGELPYPPTFKRTVALEIGVPVVSVTRMLV